jgi:hypothetical protein
MFCLSVAAGMLIWGRTFLQSHLTGWRFAAYWIVCALLAGASVTLSLIDIVLIRRGLRQKQRQLVRKTFAKIRGRSSASDLTPK